MVKRYQVYLEPHSVGILDELSEVSNFSRSQIIREAADAAASRIGNLLAAIMKPLSNNYSELDKMTDSIQIKGKKVVRLSENIDEIYYK